MPSTSNHFGQTTVYVLYSKKTRTYSWYVHKIEGAKNRLTKYEYKGMLTLELQITQTIRPRFRQGDDGKSLPSWHEYVDSMVIQRWQYMLK